MTPRHGRRMTTLAAAPAGRPAALAADYPGHTPGARTLPAGARVTPLGYGYIANGVHYVMVLGPDGETWGLPAALVVRKTGAAVVEAAA